MSVGSPGEGMLQSACASMLHSGGAITCIDPRNTGAQDLNPNLVLSDSKEGTIMVWDDMPLGFQAFP